jgi:hypothetical protein
MTAKQKSEELVNYYFNEIQKQCMAKIGGNMYDLAITFSVKHCEEMIEFIDSQMKGWLDWDLKSYFEEVIKHSISLKPQKIELQQHI